MRFKSWNIFLAIFPFFILVHLFMILFNWPIYPDEMAYRLINARLFIEGASFFNAYGAVCSQSEVGSIPIYWFLGRALNSLLFYFVETPFEMRIVGILILMLLLFILYRATGFLSEIIKSHMWRVALALSLIILGVFPYMLVLTRPDTIMAALFAFYLYMIFKGQEDADIQTIWIRGAIVVLSFVALIPLHPRAVLVLPAVIISVLSLFWKKPKFRIIGLFLVGFIAILSAHSALQHAHSFSCPESKGAMDKIVNHLQLSPLYMVQNPKQFFLDGMANVSRFPFYISNLFIKQTYPVGWVVETKNHFLDSYANLIIEILIYSYMLLLFVCVFLLLKHRSRIRIGWPLLATLTYLLVVAAFSFISNVKHFYESIPIFAPIPVIVFGLLGSLKGQIDSVIIRRIFIYPSVALSFLCAGITTAKYYPRMKTSNLGNGVPIFIKDHTFSDSLVLQKKIFNECFENEKKVNILGDTISHFLLFNQSERPRPIDLTGWLIVVMGDMKLNLFTEMIHSGASSGIFANCAYIPENLTPFAIRLRESSMNQSWGGEGTCCVSRKTIEWVKTGKPLNPDYTWLNIRM